MTTLFKFLISAAVCAYSTQVLHAEDTKLPYWKDIQTVAVNKEYPRTAFMTYDNRNQALTGEYENSPYYKLLNGTWNFYYADAYKDLPANIEQPDANIAWKEIKVPGNWEVQGYGVAIYTNHGYEFKPRNPQPPQLPETNPVGVYQRDIEIPADWDGRDIFLRLEGAKSGVYVYVNGQEVGYSEDSKNPAEFLINNYLKPGKNSLVIKIFRWSTGSYLECQDFWRMSGIERDVFLFSQPKTHIKDFNVVSTLDDTYKNGIFKLNVDVTNHTAANKEVTVAYELLDAAKKVVAEGNTPCPVTADGQKSISFEAALSNVKTWTSEHPNLYRLLISLKDGEKTSEIIPYTVGFRRFEIKPTDQIAENGKPYVLSGPASIVKKVDKVVATIDVDGMSSNLTDNVIPVLYDSDGNEVDTTQLKLSNTTVTISAKILSVKEVPLVFSTTGTPYGEYRVVEISSTPDTVKLKGASNVLNPLVSLEIPANVINVSGAREDVKTTIDISEYLPDGVELVDSSAASVTVTVRIEAYASRTYHLQTSDIRVNSLPDGLNLSFDKAQVSVTISGLQDDLNKLNASELAASIDASQLSEGTHQVELSLKLDEDHYAYQPITVSVTVKAKNTQDGDTSTDSGEDTGE